MNEQQQQAVEKAANDLYPYDEWSIPAKGMAAHIITNPSDFGLVSKEEMFEFIRWVFHDTLLCPDRKAWFDAICGSKKEYSDNEVYELFTKAKTEQK